MKPVQCEIVLSPRASARIEAARAFLGVLEPGAQALVVAPGREAADDLVRPAARLRGALFGIHRVTPGRLAGLLAADHLLRSGLAPAAGLALDAVAARVLHRLKGTGALAYFEPVLDRPGFPGALARTIDELRLSGVGPRELAAHGGARQALAAALGAFEAELDAANLADLAALLKAAVEALGGESAPPLAGIPTVWLDVAVESALERDFVAALARRAPRFLATAPAGDSRSRALLESALGTTATVAGAGPESPATSLHRLQDYLFADTAPPVPAPLDESVLVFSAPGEPHECVEIARRIQAEARRGVPFDRIAVLCHAASHYAPYLEEAFGRAGIPAYFAAGTRRPEPGGRALLTLLAGAAENLCASRFAEYLSLAQVPDPDGGTAARVFVAPTADLLPTPLGSDLDLPAAPAEREPPDPDPLPVVEGTLRAPWRWERLLVDAAVIGSRRRWERRLAGLQAELAKKRAELADEDESGARALDRALLDLAHLRDVALPIIECLAAHPVAADWKEWLGYLRSLVMLAVRDSEPVLGALAELEPMGPVGPVGLDEVRLTLGRRLGHLEARPARRRYGAVFVAPPAYARGMAFDVVIVPGLAERMFPRKLTEDPVLADAPRRAISPWLRRQEDRVAAERVALRLATGAAGARAIFSYPRLDLDQGRPRVPSFYALEILRAAEGRLPGFDELARRAACVRAARLGWPAPEAPADAIDTAEFDLAMLDGLLAREPATTAGAAHYLLNEQSNEHLPRALRARARRWLRRWTPADGLVEPTPEARAVLRRHQLSNRAYSPTALEHFAACPYRFFLRTILRLEPLERAEALEVLDPLTRGALVHEVQFEFLTGLRNQGALPVTPETLTVALGALEAAVERGAARWHDELAPAIERVWRDGIDGVRADLREWLRRMARDPEGWRPERFELAFGLAGRERADPASSGEPARLDAGLTLRGSIDLVERASDGRLRVTDHKTGRVRAQKGLVIGGGRILQPVLYALAAERVLGEPVAAGRLYYCTAAGGYEERVVEIGPAARAAARAFAGTLAGALSEGFLPAAPGKGECEWCDYRRVCGPYEEERLRFKPGGLAPETRAKRARRERLDPLWELRARP